MVRCTITPCRAAVRLNSGVSSFQKKIAAKELQAKVSVGRVAPGLGLWLSPQTPCRL